MEREQSCLNPCFNGERSVGRDVVHNVYTNMVLILVLMEDGLRGTSRSTIPKSSGSLNPCFSGRWSASNPNERIEDCGWNVLILVLVEDGLREFIEHFRNNLQLCVS